MTTLERIRALRPAALDVPDEHQPMAMMSIEGIESASSLTLAMGMEHSGELLANLTTAEIALRVMADIPSRSLMAAATESLKVSCVNAWTSAVEPFRKRYPDWDVDYGGNAVEGLAAAMWHMASAGPVTIEDPVNFCAGPRVSAHGIEVHHTPEGPAPWADCEVDVTIDGRGDQWPT